MSRKRSAAAKVTAYRAPSPAAVAPIPLYHQRQHADRFEVAPNGVAVLVVQAGLPWFKGRALTSEADL